MSKIIWDAACRLTLKKISDTFLDASNIEKADTHSDKAVFMALGQTIENFPIPAYPGEPPSTERTFTLKAIIEAFKSGMIEGGPGCSVTYDEGVCNYLKDAYGIEI